MCVYNVQSSTRPFMAIHRYLINLLCLDSKRLRSLIYATNLKLDLSHAVNIACFFFRLTIHYEAEDQFTPLHCEYMRGISVYKR